VPFQIQPGDIRDKLLDVQVGFRPLTKAVAPLEGRLEDFVAREVDGWLVLTCIAFPHWPGPPRAVGLMVVPMDVDAIPPAGLNANLLRRMTTGINDQLAEWLTSEFEEAARRGGAEPDDKRVRSTRRAVESELAKRPKATTRRTFGEAFYAKVARDAIDAGRAGHQVLAKLATRYARSDPRPKHRQKTPITDRTVKGWIHTARNGYRFLPEASLGHGVWAPTPELVGFEEREESKR
jgi:hypothetical protein